MHPLFDLSGKVALVTGASAGLGAAMARALAEAGADVAAHGNSRPVTQTCDAIAATGRRAVSIVADLQERASADRLVEETLAAFGRVDILINNAGIIRRTAAAQHLDEDWDAVLEVNLTAVFRLSRAFGRGWIARRERGKIINTASLLSFQGGVNVPGYAAAKGGLAQLTKALANEWAPHGINVNAIAPGYMVTDNTTALRGDPVRYKSILDRIPAARWGDPRDMAGAAIFLASSASDYVNGHILAVDGGWLGR